MTRSDRLGPRSTPPAPDGTPDGPFRSILFDRTDGDAGVDGAEEPAFFVDLNLDQLLESMTEGRQEYQLEPFFYAPLHDVGTVHYRHEVLRDLERPVVLRSVHAFGEQMRTMREHLAQAEKLRYTHQKERWFLDAVETYCDAVRSLNRDLGSQDVASRGLRAFRSYLADYTESDAFRSLAADTQAVKEALAGVRYSVQITGARVKVAKYEDEPNYSDEVEQTFARFKQGAVQSYLVKLPNWAEMNHVEGRILALVARLHPDVFGRLDEYSTRHRDYLDRAIAAFDREVQFYLAYLELIEPFRRAGLQFCYPRVSARSKEVSAEETFDLALANKLVPEGGKIVTNDFHLTGPERIFVVTGPNNGGKTTFARTFGQLHYLASLGLLVPGSSARLFLPDRLFTHFEREEDIETLRGKLEDELVRVHEILREATEDSVVVMNESFGSTTLNDALFLGTEVMRRILELGPLGVYVTFVDELASLSEATVSMASTIVPENPAERTFKIVRKPADGLAYAWAIAQKYGLSYDRLKGRIAA
jgi:DNA mismatch repair protein MutS